MIEGVLLTLLPQFHDERGKVMRMLRSSDKHFTSFGEIYFSTVYGGVVKGWHKHSKMSINYACISGQVKVVLYDDRVHSKTRFQIKEYFLGPDNYYLLSVPPGIWNGFKGIGGEPSIVANCSDIEHSDGEIKRIPFNDPSIPYDWKVIHR